MNHGGGSHRYTPAGIDARRYRVVAWMAVFARLVGTIFFVGFQPREFHILGYFDLTFFVPQLLLLSRFALRDDVVARMTVVESGVAR